MERPNKLVYVFGEYRVIEKEAEIFEKIYQSVLRSGLIMGPSAFKIVAANTEQAIAGYYQRSLAFVDDVERMTKNNPRKLFLEGKLEMVKVEIK